MSARSYLAPSLLIAGAAGLLYALFGRDEGEPAAPVPLPVVPGGGSGIAPNSLEIEALARVIASEAGNGTIAEQRAIGWTVRNRFRGKSIHAVEFPWRAQNAADPPFSSARPASDAHRQLAREIIDADQSADPTGGSTAFFEPKMQDAFFKAGELARAGETGDRVIDGVKLTDITRFKNYKKDANAIRAKWSKGDALYARAGRFEFWGSAKVFAQRGGTVRDVVSGVDILGAESVPASAPARTVIGFDPGPTSATTVADADLEAVARMLATEGRACTERERRAMAWTARNRAARCGMAVRDVFVDGFASTRLPATDWSRAIARAVLSQPASADPTRGAIDFWRPDLLSFAEALTAAGRLDGFAVTEDAVSDELARRGLRAIGVIGRIELLGAA